MKIEHEFTQEEIDACNAPSYKEDKPKPKAKQKKKLNAEKTAIFEKPTEIVVEFPILKSLDKDYCRKVVAMAKKYASDIEVSNIKIIELDVNEQIELNIDNALVNSEYVAVISMPRWNKFQANLTHYFQINHKLVFNLILPVLNGKNQINYTIFLYKKIN
jgi:hypothetical protein